MLEDHSVAHGFEVKKMQVVVAVGERAPSKHQHVAAIVNRRSVVAPRARGSSAATGNCKTLFDGGLVKRALPVGSGLIEFRAACNRDASKFFSTQAQKGIADPPMCSMLDSSIESPQSFFSDL